MSMETKWVIERTKSAELERKLRKSQLINKIAFIFNLALLIYIIF